MKPLAIVNEYGNFDLAHNKLPKRYVHISGLRLQPLCRSLGIRYCDAVVAFEQYRSGCYTPIKDGVIVTAASETKLRWAIAAREARSEKTQRRKDEAIARKNEEHVQWLSNLTVSESIVLGCDALFRINRVAKRRNCSDMRDNIYNMKNEWIRFLYCAGYCDRCVHHTVQVKEKSCYRCDGFGTDYSDDECWQCAGTGRFQEAEVLTYVLFSFDIEGIRYTWHQPIEDVNFVYGLTESQPSDFTPDGPKVEMMPMGEINRFCTLLSACLMRLQEHGLIAPHERQSALTPDYD